jgi:hypothetical protein
MITSTKSLEIIMCLHSSRIIHMRTPQRSSTFRYPPIHNIISNIPTNKKSENPSCTTTASAVNMGPLNRSKNARVHNAGLSIGDTYFDVLEATLGRGVIPSWFEFDGPRAVHSNDRHDEVWFCPLFFSRTPFFHIFCRDFFLSSFLQSFRRRLFFLIFVIVLLLPTGCTSFHPLCGILLSGSEDRRNTSCLEMWTSNKFIRGICGKKSIQRRMRFYRQQNVDMDLVRETFGGLAEKNFGDFC